MWSTALYNRAKILLMDFVCMGEKSSYFSLGGTVAAYCLSVTFGVTLHVIVLNMHLLPGHAPHHIRNAT